MKFDHHMHTKRHSPDSEIDPLLLIERAREIGLDGVVITEHDYQWEAGELADLAARAAPLRVFSGAEISAREGHFLVYGLPSLDDVPAGRRAGRPARHRRRHQAAIVAAHPFRWDQPFDVDRRRTRPGLRRTRAGEQQRLERDPDENRGVAATTSDGQPPARAMLMRSTSSAAISPSLTADRFARRVRDRTSQSPRPPAAPAGGQPDFRSGRVAIRGKREEESPIRSRRSQPLVPRTIAKLPQFLPLGIKIVASLLDQRRQTLAHFVRLPVGETATVRGQRHRSQPVDLGGGRPHS